MSHVPTIDTEFRKMGGCNCKKRKLRITNGIELLPSKTVLDKLMTRYRLNDNKVKDIGETAQQINTELEENQNNENTEKLNMHLTRQQQKEKENQKVEKCHNSISIKTDYCQTPSPKIIIHQNIVIKYGNKKQEKCPDKNSMDKNHNYTNAGTFSFRNSTKLKVIENEEKGTKLHVKETLNVENSKDSGNHFKENKISLSANYVYSNDNVIKCKSSYKVNCEGNVNDKESKEHSKFTKEKKGEDLEKIPDTQQDQKDLSLAHYSGEAYEEWDSLSSYSSIFNKGFFVKRISNGSIDFAEYSSIINSFEVSNCCLNIDNIINSSNILAELSSSWHKINNNAHASMKSVTRQNSTRKYFYVGDFYNSEYSDDIFKYIRGLEITTALKNDFLNKYNPDEMLRSKTINWMLVIQPEVDFDDSEFYIAVYLLDKVLSNIYIPGNMYKLLAISTLWIAMKLCGSNDITASMLIAVSQECYSISQLLKMEENVLRLVNFQVYSLEPSICVTYYLKLLGLQYDNLARLSAMYALDFLTLLPEFSSTKTSLVAAAVVSFIQGIINKDMQIKIYRIFLEMFSTREIQEIKSLEILLYIQLKNMTDENYIFKEPYNKYNFGHLICISEFMKDIV